MIDATDVLHAIPALVLSGLALFFGRSLGPGQMALIERIARVSDPALTPALCRYVRRLTIVWCAYFIVAALLSLRSDLRFGWTSALVWSGTVALFVGEHWLRPRLFPGQVFPGLTQQLRDTWSVWRRRP
jgi:uncharacterized membrane protein